MTDLNLLIIDVVLYFLRSNRNYFNLFYFILFQPIGDKICKICRNFVLWSAVMVGPFNSPYPRASTATVESDFANLKTRVLRNENLPMSIDKFVSLHLNAIDGQTKICQANVSVDDEADTGDPSYSGKT